MALTSLEVVRTDNMRTAAVLIASGFPLQSIHSMGRITRKGDAVLEFAHLTDEDKKPLMEDIIERCGRGYDLDIYLRGEKIGTLRGYEDGFKEIRDAADRYHDRERGNRDDGNGRPDREDER